VLPNLFLILLVLHSSCSTEFWPLYHHSVVKFDFMSTLSYVMT